LGLAARNIISFTITLIHRKHSFENSFGPIKITEILNKIYGTNTVLAMQIGHIFFFTFFKWGMD